MSMFVLRTKRSFEYTKIRIINNCIVILNFGEKFLFTSAKIPSVSINRKFTSIFVLNILLIFKVDNTKILKKIKIPPESGVPIFFF